MSKRRFDGLTPEIETSSLTADVVNGSLIPSEDNTYQLKCPKTMENHIPSNNRCNDEWHNECARKHSFERLRIWQFSNFGKLFKYYQYSWGHHFKH